jgi:outer membrane lipoprotein SlyB
MKAMRSLAMMMCLSLVLPFAARAQGVAHSFAELETRLKPGQTVIVTQANGRTLRGAFAELTASELRVEVPGHVEHIAYTDVQSIALREHRVTMRGPVIGGLAGLGLGIFLVEALRDCGGCGENGAIAVRAVSAVIGAAAGAALESARGQTRFLYWAPSQTIRVAPILLPSRQGLEIRIRF